MPVDRASVGVQCVEAAGAKCDSIVSVAPPPMLLGWRNMAREGHNIANSDQSLSVF